MNTVPKRGDLDIVRSSTTGEWYVIQVIDPTTNPIKAKRLGRVTEIIEKLLADARQEVRGMGCELGKAMPRW